MNITEKIFQENEIKTNKLGTWCVIMATVLCFVFGLLLLFGTIETQFPEMGLTIIGCCLIELFLFVLIRILGYANPKTKYIVITGMVLIGGLSFFLYPLASIFLFCVPLLISVKYYYPKLTIWVSAIVLFVFVLAVCANVFFELEVPIMQDIHAEQEMTLWADIPYTIKYYVLPKSAILIIGAIAAYYITKAGKKLIIDHAKASREAALMSAELDTAAKIQKISLPKERFTTPDGRAQISAFIKPARNVGGDFYDYFMINDHYLLSIVADVSDKGLPSAMYGVEAQSYVRFAFSEGLQSYLKNFGENASDDINFIVLEKFLNAINHQLSIHNMDGMFVTMWLGLFDTRTGRGKFVNAGHCMPFIRRVGGSVCEVSNEPQFFMGAFENANLKANDIELKKGESLILYTDGVTDARNDKDEVYGVKRFKEAIKNAATSKDEAQCEVIVKSVVSDIESFIGDETHFDDITLEVLHFEG